MSKIISVDLIILGGGIAGLWTLNCAVKAGYNAILIESDKLGGGQTIHSQGIIHGGIKYALNGVLTPASNSIKEMPEIWKSCLAGKGQVDLSGTNVLSDAHYMWSQKSLGGRLSTFFASKALRGRVSNVPNHERPRVFQDPGFKGSLYRLNELVLDVPTVIHQLAEPVKERLFKVTADRYHLETHDGIHAVKLHQPDITIEAAQIVSTCGEGFSYLKDQLTKLSAMQHSSAQLPTMQLRPLHMVMVKHHSDLPLYAHCFAGGTRPLITVTTHFTKNGKSVWYLGGDLAEQGVLRSESEQINAANQAIQTLLPWVTLNNPQWQTVHINRAEPAQTTLTLPDAAFTKQLGNLIIAWPTKLALAPDLANKVLSLLPAPIGGPVPESLSQLARPEITAAIWENNHRGNNPWN